MSATELVVRPEHHPVEAITDTEINTLFRLAKALAMSGMFEDARQAEQAFAKLILGRDLGLSATSAMTGIHIVKGKPELSANLQASLLRSTPGYDYRVRELTEDACSIEFLRAGDSLGTERYTMDDAQRAGIKGGMYSKFPRNMLFARAMTNGTAFYCPEVTLGIRVYAPGEISGADNIASDLIKLPDDVVDATADDDQASPQGSEPPTGAAAAHPSRDELKTVAAAPQEPLVSKDQYAAIVAAFRDAGAPVEQLAAFLGCDATPPAVAEFCTPEAGHLSQRRADETIAFLRGLTT